MNDFRASNCRRSNNKAAVNGASQAPQHDRLAVVIGILLLCNLFLRRVILIFFGGYWQIIHATQFMVVLALAIICFSRHAKDVLPVASRWALWMASYAVLLVISSLAADAEFSFWIRYVFYFSISAVYFIFFRLASRYPLVLRALSRALIVLAMVNAVIGIWGTATQSRMSIATAAARPGAAMVGTFGYDEYTGRSGGLTGENYVGVWLAPATAWATLQVFVSSLRLVPAVVGGCAGLAIVASLSRTSILCGFVTVLASVFVGMYRKTRILGALLAFVALSLFLWCAYLFFSYTLENLSSHAFKSQTDRFSMESEDVSSRRFDIWKDALELWKKSPFIGNGADALDVTTGMSTHNAFLDILVDTGLVGFVIFYGPLFMLARRTWRYRRCLNGDQYFAFVFCIAAGAAPAMFALSCAYKEPIMWIVWGLLAGRVDFLVQCKRQTTPRIQA